MVIKAFHLAAASILSVAGLTAAAAMTTQHMKQINQSINRPITGIVQYRTYVLLTCDLLKFINRCHLDVFFEVVEIWNLENIDPWKYGPLKIDVKLASVGCHRDPQLASAAAAVAVVLAVAAVRLAVGPAAVGPAAAVVAAIVHILITLYNNILQRKN